MNIYAKCVKIPNNTNQDMQEKQDGQEKQKCYGHLSITKGNNYKYLSLDPSFSVQQHLMNINIYAN